MKSYSFKSCTILCFLSLWVTNLYAQQWQYVGEPRFTIGSGSLYSDIALNNGIPYVAFREGVKVTVMSFDGANWNAVGMPQFSWGQWSEYIDLEFNNDTPYVAYVGPQKVTLAKFDGSNWGYVGDLGYDGFSDGYGTYVRLEFMDDVPYVAYVDEVHENKISVMRFVSNSWHYVGQAGFSAEADFIDLKIINSIPYVVYSDQSNDGKTTVMRFDGTWSLVGSAGFSEGEAWYHSITYDDATGTPFVAYRDVSVDGKTTAHKFNGISWEVVGQSGFNQSSSGYQNIVVYEGTPYVGFNQHGATVMKFENSEWSSLGPIQFNEGSSASFISMDIQDGAAYVAFGENGVGGGVGVSVMKYSEPLSVENLSNKKPTVSIYPNPAQNHIKVNSSHPIHNISVFDMQGQLRLSGKNSSPDIGNLSAGVYLVKTTLDEIQVFNRFIKL